MKTIRRSKVVRTLNGHCRVGRQQQQLGLYLWIGSARSTYSGATSLSSLSLRRARQTKANVAPHLIWEEDHEDVVGWCRFRDSRGFLLTGVRISVLHENHLAWGLLRLHY
jgi:hypothetical protein